jgi:uncharacterized membrane protein
MSKSTANTLFLVRFSILLALEAIVCFTPLGSLPIGPMVATLMMIPVIVTGIVLGPKAGTAMGLIAGLFSLIVWTFMPPPASAILAFLYTPFYSLGEIHGNFWSLVICLVPRALGGTVAGLIFRALDGKLTGAKKAAAYGLAGLACSMVNTIGVLGGSYIFFGEQLAEVAGMVLGAILMIIVTNGIPEAIVCTILAAAICQPLRLVARK